ncbi:ras-associating and dilute domain-containing protein-like [Tachysurus vachellii]|uniref:ras-associating and dilute domain-containing protein-like n=1 Tax=Tachysurus vachellii TaxID=175792 RepID=UPI00296B133F|nr:ras-associating and dilute domain-containing protein-like [Tachysurus vachellii]
MCIYVEFVFITPRSFLQFSKLLNEDAVVRKMISEERSNQFNKQALGFPIGLLIRSPKKRLATLGRKPSNGSLQSNTSECTTRSSESAGVRQPARSKIRRHNNKLATVFNRSPVLQDSKPGLLGGNLELNDDPTELSSQLSAPGILKIFGSDICQGTNYKSVLATNHSSAKELVKEALERYCLEKEDPDAYVLCDVIGHTGIAHQWQTESLRVIGDNEKPLILQSLWKPKEGFCRRFEIHTRLNIEERNAKDRDTITAGLNARMRNLQKVNSRVTSLFVDGSSGNMDSIGIWRSLSDMDLSAMGKEASRANKGATLQEDPEAEADLDRSCLITEKEETESSDDNNTQYSIHPPFDFPYFLLLQGYSHRQDFVIYLMSGNSCVFGKCAGHGEDGEQLKVDVVLYAPDVLPQHCCVQHLDVPRTQAEGSRRSTTLLKPLQGGCVTHNGVQLKGQAELFPGDLIGLGQHYLFMFKDPTAPDVQCIPTWMARLSPQASASPCNACGSPVKRHRKSRRVPGFWKDPDKHVISLTYELHQEDQVLEKILTIVDPRGPEPKLIPAFLLCLCIQHSAAYWEMTNFCKLLLQIANQIQLAMWERTKELALLQPENGIGDGQPEPEVFCMLNIAELIQGLQPLVLWMANSIELLHFIQHEVPLLLPWTQQDEEQDKELINSEILSIRTASEEAMTVLEEVIMFTFQQTVYYLTRRLYSVLPGMLDSNPFSENGQMRIPEGVSNVLDVLKEALQLLNTFKVHSDITSQLLAYLFFFTNASLFNILMERGSGGGFYQWSKGVQLRANLDLLMDWTQSIGLGDLSTEFFKKLSSAVNLLATPKENLLQTSWGSLRVEFPHLNPAQLHHMLREYNTTRACPSCWTPSPEEAVSALQTSEILESFDNHPPLILPNNSFHLDLGKPITQPAFLSHLKSLQDFIDSIPINQIRNEQQPELRNNSTDHMEVTQIESSPSTSEVECLGSTKATSSPTIQCDYIAEQQQCLSASPPQLRGFHNALGSCEALLSQKLKNLELQNSLPGETDLHSQKSLALDPSCLLTPPNTPQGLELSDLEASLQAEDTQNAENGLRGNTVRVRETEEDEDEEDEVFTVEVSRGPHGFGLALVDGLKSPLGMNGIYIKSVVPGSPAAQCQKLRLGDRILAVNGVSLVGMDYQTGREIIRTSGDSLRFLVAKTEGSNSGRSSSTRC